MSEPDLTFVNGTVITVDPAFRLAGGLAVRDGRIVAVGTTADVAATAGPRTRVVDLAGGAVLPGINDSHLHAAMLGAYWPTMWMDGLAGGGGFPVPRELRTAADRRAALRRAWDVLLPLGITGYTEPGLGPGADGQHGDACGAGTLAAYTEAAAAGELPLRVTALLLFGELDGPGEPEDLVRGLGETVPGRPVGGFGSGRAVDDPPPASGGADPRWWRVSGVKLFADGIPPMRTAWMSRPYVDGGRGAPITTGADEAERLGKLRTMVEYAHRAGHQVGVHATGDAAVDATVRAFTDAMTTDGRRDPRHYVIHGDCASPTTLGTMARHGIGLNAQPGIYTATGDLLEAALGERRTAEACALRTAVDVGARVCLSSDGPVTVPDWRAGVAAAVLRRCGPSGTVRGGEQRIAVREAIRGYTIDAAWQDRAEHWKGSVEVGKVADLCVLVRDPLAVPAAEIPDIDVVMTVIDGTVVHEV